MTEKARKLLELQSLDAEIARLKRQLQQEQTALGDTLKQRAAELAIRQADQVFQQRQREQRDLEYELNTLDARIKEHEQRLYSGKGSPRDLQSLQHDIERDRGRKGTLEENVLAAMDATETAKAEVDRVKRATERVLGAEAGENVKHAQERDRLQADLERRTSQRAALASEIDAVSLALYDRLRQRMPDGVAVAELTQNRCEGCRTTLPSAEIQRARHTDALAQCSVCGRIIDVPIG